MMHLTTDAVKQLKKFIMKSFRESGKKHLLITGCKICGKTTVLNEILKNEKSYGGIRTYAVRDDKIPPKFVVMQDINYSSINGIIAVRNEACTGLIPMSETFENLGMDILNRYIKSDNRLIAIDEIGFLEDNSPNYQNEIMKCFEKKSVMAVIRKETTPFVEKLLNRQDTFCVDIENLIKEESCLL